MPSLLRAVNRLIKAPPFVGASGLENLYFYYAQIVEQARDPLFYEAYGVPDSLEGRFDCLSLHMALVCMAMKTQGEGMRSFSQKLFDLFFADVDRNLREMGVGDLSVGRQVKKLVSDFYGSLHAYEMGLSQPELLLHALERNLYGGHPPKEMKGEGLLRYMKQSITILTQIPFMKTRTIIEWPALEVSHG